MHTFASKTPGHQDKSPSSGAQSRNPFAPNPKLTVSRPGDIYEQEADRAADEVMRLRKPEQECLGCGEKIPGQGSSGHALPASVRGFFETRFGHDFSKVRVYSDNNAAEMASGLHARAFTVGNDIYFGSREYAPGTSTGDKLLAHELTHTIQQSRGGSHDLRGGPGRTAPTDKLDDALPTALSYTAGSAANTCKVGKPIDINSQAKIITASKPGPKGWTATAPLATLNKVLG